MKKAISIMLVSAIVVSLLTGCGDKNGNLNETSEALGIVLSIRSNFCAVPQQTLAQEIYDCAYGYGTVDVVLVQGSPQVSGSYRIDDPGKNINNAKRKQLAEQNSTAILNQIAALKANTPEADTLQAIKIAANQLSSGTPGSKRKLLIVDNGLTTSGLLDFTKENIISTAPEQIVSKLSELHALPDLSDIDVVWIGIAQTAGDQKRVSASYGYKLEALWKAILNAAGASVMFAGTQLPSEEPTCDLPYVSTVPIVEDKLDLQAETVPEIIGFNENSSVKFVGDQAIFVDPKAAENTLKPIAEYLISSREQRYIIGMTATHGDPIQRELLSLNRAETCKNVLIEYGVSPEQLITVGLGFKDNPLRVRDIDDSGKLIEPQAKINRAVYFISPSSPLVDTVIRSNL